MHVKEFCLNECHLPYRDTEKKQIDRGTSRRENRKCGVMLSVFYRMTKVMMEDI